MVWAHRCAPFCVANVVSTRYNRLVNFFLFTTEITSKTIITFKTKPLMVCSYFCIIPKQLSKLGWCLSFSVAQNYSRLVRKSNFSRIRNAAHVGKQFFSSSAPELHQNYEQSGKFQNTQTVRSHFHISRGTPMSF